MNLKDYLILDALLGNVFPWISILPTTILIWIIYNSHEIKSIYINVLTQVFILNKEDKTLDWTNTDCPSCMVLGKSSIFLHTSSFNEDGTQMDCWQFLPKYRTHSGIFASDFIQQFFIFQSQKTICLEIEIFSCRT